MEEVLSQATPSSTTRTAAVVFAGFCAFVTLFAPQPLLPMLAREFRVSAGAISLVVTASTLAVAMAAPFAGVVADRFGRKRVIVPAAFLLAAPTLLAATATSFGQLLFWRFLQGIFTPGIFAVIIAYINEEWEAGAGAATAAYVTGTVLGGFSGRALAAVVASHASWRWAFVMLGMLNLLGAMAIRAWLPAGKRFTRARRGGPVGGAMLRHLRNPRLVATYAVGFCVMFSLLGTFTYVNFYLAAPPFGLSTTALGLLFVVYLVGAVVTPTAGRAIDRFGHRFALVAAFTGGADRRVFDTGSQPARGDDWTDAGVHRRVHRQLGGIELRRQRGNGIAGLRGGAVRDVLLPGRQRRECDPGIFLDAWRVAGVRRTDCRGAVGDDLAGADFLAAAAEGGGSSGVDGGD